MAHELTNEVKDSAFMSPRIATRRPNPSHVQAAVELAYIAELLLATESGLTFEAAPASHRDERRHSARIRAGATPPSASGRNEEQR
jgi:hypothetical protein